MPFPWEVHQYEALTKMFVNLLLVYLGAFDYIFQMSVVSTEFTHGTQFTVVFATLSYTFVM